MSRAAAWRWCALAGTVVFVCSWSFGRIPGLVACGPGNGLGPILAFEFVRSPADVAALFGAEPCRSTLVAAQRTGLLLDGLGFIPAYTAFLALAAWAAGRSRPLIAVFVIAGLCDEVEGELLHMILRDLPGTQATIDALWVAVHAKFALLALGTLGIAVLLGSTRRAAGIAAGVAAGAGAATAFYGLAADPGVMMRGFAIGWVTILLAALAALLRPALFAVPAAPPRSPAPPSA